jgi:hypothetical protein
MENTELKLHKEGMLPSRFQIGHWVDVIFTKMTLNELPKQIDACKVIGIHFTESKVLYDLETTIDIDHANKIRHTTRIYRVDSEFVFPRHVQCNNLEWNLAPLRK